MSEAATQIPPIDAPQPAAAAASDGAVVVPLRPAGEVAPAEAVTPATPNAALTPLVLGLGVLVLVVVALIITAGATGSVAVLVVGLVGLVIALALLIMVTLRFVGEGAADESAPAADA
jgi:hypothetical protein